MNPHARVLIVDDEPNVRLVFRAALETIGLHIDEAIDGEDALDRLSEFRPDLILLDLHMPSLDGMEMLRLLRESGSDVPVVIITAHGSIADAVEAMKLGAIDFLTKPLTPESLRNTVSDVLGRHAHAESKTTSIWPSDITPQSQFIDNMSRAKRALNRRWFGEAEIFLRQAIALRDDSPEAHNLLGILHEMRNEHDDSYKEYKAALKADKHYEPAQNNMRRYYERFTFGQSVVPIDPGV